MRLKPCAKLSAQVFMTNMNLLGSHDVSRVMTALSGIHDPGERSKQVQIHLSPDLRKEAINRLLMATLFQSLYPGMPSLYYGDEVAMEGFRDPFNRRTFPWGREENSSIVESMRSFYKARKHSPMLRYGYIEMLYARGEALAFKRYAKDGKGLCGEKIDEEDITVVLNYSANPMDIRTLSLI